jgi:hypothetical protein
MNRNKLLGMLFLVLAVTLAAVAKDVPKSTMGVGETRNITFVSPVKIGNAALPAGTYRVEHVMEGENHVMVFQSLSNKQATARVNCQMIQLQKKAGESTQEYDSQNGEKVLKAITFRGDMYKHQF